MAKNQSPKQQPVQLVPISLVVCDNVYTEPGGQQALVGLFNKIVATGPFPLVVPRLCIYLSVTEVYPGCIFNLQLVNIETDDVVIQGVSQPAPAHLDPSQIVDFVFMYLGVKFPAPGRYDVRVSGSDNRVLLQRPIDVVDKPANRTGEPK